MIVTESCKSLNWNEILRKIYENDSSLRRSHVINLLTGYVIVIPFLNFEFIISVTWPKLIIYPILVGPIRDSNLTLRSIQIVKFLPLVGQIRIG